ncbi:MAG: hypothetical protein FWG55_02530 [Candidatus Bathyarchaeota archaeon]|nr:hypothetical protein [Candidatus Termiticorpusculum sp.]
MVKYFQVLGHNLSIKRISILFIALLLLTSLLTVALLSPQPTSSIPPEQTYVGVSFCGSTIAEAKLLIDKVKDYTNLFVLQSGPISLNMTETTEICDYATSQGLSIIVYFGWFNPNYPWQYPWVQNAPQRYGDKFLGVYYYDEPGGIQLDYDWENHFINMSNRLKEFGANHTRYRVSLDSITGYLNGTIRDYAAEAQIYVNYTQHDHDLSLLKNSSIPTFVSDYALYWWDYLGGYDVVLTQLGNNASIIQEINLTKGAAHLQNKDWGVIVTWKYDNAPYLDNGEEIYNQMSLAYQAGAKYIIIFDYPLIEGNPYGVLTEDHFEALQKLWTDINKPKTNQGSQTEAVLVLPQNYGWGMRHVADRIWIWGPDEHCQTIWNISQKLIDQYGINIDIIYDDPQFSINDKYSQIYYWNQTLT